eukprot:g17878.t1
MRIFRFVIALRTLVRSIMHTLKALIWAMLLLTLIVYVFAVLFTQIVDGAEKDLGVDAPEMANSTRYFGSLPQTMLSLFMSITGGVSWEAVIEPLTFISPVWSLVFLFYISFIISFIYFAVLNVVTGVFCQSAIESAQNDHLTVAQSLIDNKEAHVERLRTLFAELGAGDEAGITFYAFEEKMHDPAVREYFETLGINVYDAWSFFKLLDADGGGFVEPEEFFRGCLKFRGHARAIEVGKKLISESFLQPYAYASSPSSPSFWMEGLTDSLSASDPTSRQASDRVKAEEVSQDDPQEDYTTFAAFDEQLKLGTLSVDAKLSRKKFANARGQSTFTNASHQRCRKNSWVSELVRHPGFDAFFACVVVTNAVFIGIDLEEQMQRMLDPFQRFLMRPDQVCQQLFDDAVLRAMQQAADFRKIATKGESSKLRQTKAAAALTQENLPTEGLPHASDYNPKVTVWRALSRPQEPVG